MWRLQSATLKLCAEKGNQYAQYSLGMVYLKGDEVPIQAEEAVKWLQQAADQGYEWRFISWESCIFAARTSHVTGKRQWSISLHRQNRKYLCPVFTGSFGFISESLLVSGSDQAVHISWNGYSSKMCRGH